MRKILFNMKIFFILGFLKYFAINSYNPNFGSSMLYLNESFFLEDFFYLVLYKEFEGKSIDSVLNILDENPDPFIKAYIKMVLITNKALSEIRERIDFSNLSKAHINFISMAIKKLSKANRLKTKKSIEKIRKKISVVLTNKESYNVFFKNWLYISDYLKNFDVESLKSPLKSYFRAYIDELIDNLQIEDEETKKFLKSFKKKAVHYPISDKEIIKSLSIEYKRLMKEFEKEILELSPTQKKKKIFSFLR